MKQTIVLIHGAWHWGGCFQKVATLLAARGHCIIHPDLKSHGFDPATYDQVEDMADYTASVAALLESAHEPFVLLGHSMGACRSLILPRNIRRRSASSSTLPRS